MKKLIMILQVMIVTLISILPMRTQAQTIWMIDYTSYSREVQSVVNILSEDFKPLQIKIKFNMEDVYVDEGDFLIYLSGESIKVDSINTIINFEFLFFRLNEYFELVFKGGESRLFNSNRKFEYTRVLRNSLMNELRSCFEPKAYATPKDPNIYRVRNETVKGIEK